MPPMDRRSKIALVLAFGVPNLIVALVLFYNPSDIRNQMPSHVPVVEAIPIQGIQIDGDLDDWPGGMEEYPILHHRQVYGPTDIDDADLTVSADLNARFRVGYDPVEPLIYVAVQVRDDILTVGSLHSETDGCEIYVDGDHSGETSASVGADRRTSPFPAIQYIAVPGVGTYGQEVDKTNPAMGPFGGIKRTRTRMAFRREGGITTYEWAVEAFDHYPKKPTQLVPGKILGFDVAVADKDDPNGNAAWVCWGPYAPKKFRHAHFLGDLVLNP